MRGDDLAYAGGLVCESLQTDHVCRLLSTLEGLELAIVPARDTLHTVGQLALIFVPFLFQADGTEDFDIPLGGLEMSLEWPQCILSKSAKRRILPK